MDSWIVAITGATGIIYARRMLEALKQHGVQLCLTISEPGKRVIHDELGWSLTGDVAEIEYQLRTYLGYQCDDRGLRYFDSADIGCCLASGSFPVQGMIVIPCSMATVAGIAHGMSRNLIERAADVILKERRPLIVVPRETPLNTIHLRNMLALAEIGVQIVPPMPAFYSHPQTIEDLIDFFIKRMLQLIGVSKEPSWQWE